AQVAVATVDLDRVERVLHRHLADHVLRARRLHLVRSTLLLQPRRAVARRAARLEPHLHLRELVRDRLEARDRPAELLALLRITDARVERRLHPADAARHHHRALPVEALERDPPERLALRTEYGVRRHPAVDERDLCGRRRAAAHLVELATDPEAGIVG